MAPPLSLLVITAAPDARPSTAHLREIVDEADGHDGVSVEVWFLRCGPQESPWPGARVIDELRTWAPARLVDRTVGRRVGDRVRGARQRWWVRRLSPDAVVLDDGLGARTLGRYRPEVTVIRTNPNPPEDALLEEPPRTDADIVRVDIGVGDHAAVRERATPATRRRTREVLDLPVDVDLIVGWSPDGDVDGFADFLQAVAATATAADRSVDGLWLAAIADPAQMADVVATIRRHGLSGRVHLRPTRTLAAMVCGDAVVLPAHGPPERDEIVTVVAAGLGIVVGHDCGVEDPDIVTTSAQGPGSAAPSIATWLTRDRDDAVAQATVRLDVRAWTDRLLDDVRTVRADRANRPLARP